MSLLRRRLLMENVGSDEMKEWRLLKEMTTEKEESRVNIGGFDCTELKLFIQFRTSAISAKLTILPNGNWGVTDPCLEIEGGHTDWDERREINIFANGGYAYCEESQNSKTRKKTAVNNPAFNSLTSVSLAMVGGNLATGAKIAVFGR